MDERKAFDEAVVSMTISGSPYSHEYMFYLHIVAQCEVKFDKSLPAAAGVSFHQDHYKLWLNPREEIGKYKDDKGNEVVVQGFHADMPLKQRIGILKHEMLHIVYNHVGRKEERNHKAFNVASDCALDQDITRDHLPEYAIYPDNYPVEKGIKVLERQNAEYYYDLLPEEMKKEEEDKGEGGQGAPGGGSGEGEGELKEIDPINHDKWLESEGDEEIKRELTKKMVENSANSTQKSAGRLPSDYSKMIDGLTDNKEVNWKQVLRKLVGNKKVNSRRTLMRRDRRLPKFNWIKGKTKDRVFELAVISDVSGSVNDQALTTLWSAIRHICTTFKTPVTMVQVDTQPSVPEELTAKTKLIERKACGGTILAPAIKMLDKHKIKYDAIVVTTDGYLFPQDIEPFEALRVPVIWLIESGGQEMTQMTSGRMRSIKLKE